MKAYLLFIIIVVSLGGFLFGFDMAVVSGIIPLVKEDFALTAFQEGLFVSSALIGCIIGVAFAGKLSDRYGRKSLLIAAAALFFLSAIACSLSPDFFTLLIARCLSGVGVGVASIVVPLYIAEVSPASSRGRMVTCYQLAVTIGILIAYLSNAAVLQYDWQWIDGSYWRMMFLIGAIPALLFWLGLYRIPESPRWLMQKGNEGRAAEVIRRLRLTEVISASSVTQETGKVSLWKPMYRQALLLGLLLPLFSQLSGINAIIYFGPTILVHSGLSLSGSLQTQIYFGLANVIFTGIAIWKVDSWGRRPLYLVGSAGATICLLLTAWFLNLNMENYGWLLALPILGFLLFFAFSIGPLKFVVASEIFPGAIRAKAMALSVLVMWVADAIVGQLTPIMLDAWGATWTFRFFAACCAVAFLAVYALLPETKGKTLETIEAYWQEKFNKNRRGENSN
ncbi:sugar porter family MFS transporter [Olivibacter sp. XZL3]|uniref:sugar porter family MFS transporter n=1 Tax=Olivibacter sp. XZL3 TaxID=1735116 RepID=UPI0014170C3F|nr:sugar porter family MFS transporter [Olivibacter sp. XZL3]